MPAASKLARKRVKNKLAKKAVKKTAKKRVAPSDADQLTPKQRRFADNYLNGESGANAARLAGYIGKSSDVLSVTANKLLKIAKVRSYVDEHMQAESAEATLSRQRKREILKGIAEAWKASDKLEGDRQAAIQAIKVDNSMTGDDAPVRVEGELTLKGILQAVTGSTGLPQDEED